MVNKPSYRLFLDESGDHSYGKVVEEPFRLLMKGKVIFESMFPSYPLLEKDGNRYLGLTATIFNLDYYNSKFSPSISEFKQSIFGDDVVLHAKDIIQRRGAFYSLQDSEKAKTFDDGLLSLVRSSSYHIINIVIDKKNHVIQYANPWHPYHYCLKNLLQRYCFLLNRINGTGDIIAECRGKKENYQLQNEYEQIFNYRRWEISG